MVVPFAGTSSGARRSLTGLLQERINPTESLQYKRSHLYKVTSSASVGKTTNTPDLCASGLAGNDPEAVEN